MYCERIAALSCIKGVKLLMMMPFNRMETQSWSIPLINIYLHDMLAASHPLVVEIPKICNEYEAGIGAATITTISVLFPFFSYENCAKRLKANNAYTVTIS